MRILSLFFAVLVAALSACRPDVPYYSGEGKMPLYISKDSLGNIYNIPVQPVTNSGTIFWRDTLFFMLEQLKGVHVFDVSDTANPVALAFIQIPAVHDFTLNGNLLYADNGGNLTSIDITDILSIKVLNVQKNVFQPVNFPVLYTGYFECVDESRGVVIAWVDTIINNAACRTFN